MKIGLTLVFDGAPGRTMADIAPAARRAEEAGCSSLWFPEHVVFVDGAASQYPYGTLRMGRKPGVYDPLIALTVAATATNSIRLGTGVLILPQREPLTLAQQLVALDHASNGRFDLGIGVGWLREETEALGVPWERRGERADDYVSVMRKLWRDDVIEHHSTFVDVAGIQAWPKPVQSGGPPIWVGGNTPAAIRRTARCGDGWFGWALSADEVAAAQADLRAECTAVGRDPANVGVKIGIAWPGDVDGLEPYVRQLAGLGIGELIVAPGSTDPARLSRLAERASR